MEKVYNTTTEQAEFNPNIAALSTDYLETYYQLTVVNINQKTALISAAASFSMLGAMIGGFAAIFFGIACSLWLGTLMDNSALGFLIVGVLFLVLFILLFFTRKKLFYPFVKNLVIKNIYE